MDAREHYQRCLHAFRGKDYAAALACFEDYLRLGNLSGRDQAMARRNVAECLVELDLAGQATPDLQARFSLNLDGYFAALAAVPPTDLSSKPLAELFASVLRFILQTAPLAETRQGIVAAHARFMAEGRPRLSDEEVIDAFRKTLDRERLNVDRHDHSARATAVAEALLAVLGDTPAMARQRAATYDTLADIAYFHPKNGQTDVERYTLVAGYLQESLAADPQDGFAREFLKHVERLRSVTLQIKRFGHDVGNRLQNIKLVTSRLKASVATEEERQLLHEIDRDLKSLKVLGAIINRTLPEPSDWAVVDPSEFVRQVIQGRGWPASCLALVGEPTPWEICPDFLQVALHNLVKNAVESYGRTGLAVPAEPCVVTIDYAARTITVKDHAGGIDPSLENIFDPYVSSKGVSIGTSGLGLTNARAAVEAHGRGCVLELAARQPTDGAEFVIRLPTHLI
jgi:signal transduction histidine kinase